MDPDIPDCPEGDMGWVEGECAQVVDFGSDMGPGIPPGFVALILLALLVGVAITLWKVSTARRMAEASGMDVGDATAMTLMSEGGLDATYLASNLRNPSPQPAAPSPEDRLRKLAELREQGLITPEEYDERRSAVLGDL